MTATFLGPYAPAPPSPKPGERARLIYAIREYRGRKGEPKGSGWRDFRDLIVRAHIQLGAPIGLVWDNVRLHLTAGMKDFIAANSDWLIVFQLPTYAPDLNPTEGIWSLVKRDLGNLEAADLGRITRAVKRKLRMLQCRPQVIDGCFAETGLGFGKAPLTVAPAFATTVGVPISIAPVEAPWGCVQLGLRRGPGVGCAAP